MSTAVKKKNSSKEAPKGKGHVRSVRERRDDDVMNTNDSSIVSKRSVSKLYFPDEPDFYQPFVQKYVRRNPLINRGYWLRMHAIEQVVRRFIEENDKKTKVIVNLGCGYDPLPFQFWHRYGPNCNNAVFVDVDYPQLIERKRDRMLSASLQRDALLKTNLRSAQLPIYLRSDRYMALGCDLRDLTTIERILKTEFDCSSTSILFVAEVSVTYMPVSDADALIRWASKLEDARFCLLEQYLPQGPDHPFAHTMLKHFNKLQTPIHAVKEYPSLALQKTRFTTAGWPILSIARNLWDLWSDDTFTPPGIRRRLDSIEPFDEWEEFALFAGHYFLLLASTWTPEQQGGATMDASPDTRVEDIVDIPCQTSVSVSQVSFPEPPLEPRRFGAAFSPSHDALAVHGGQGVQQRLTSMDLLHRADSVANELNFEASAPQARICHTITTLSGNDALLVGGRKSPSQALTDCWLMRNGKWQEVEAISPGRFRHSSIRVTIAYSGSGADGEADGVLVMGGKTSDGAILSDCTVWTANHGWQNVPIIGKRPPARFGAAICSMGAQNWGLLLGGMTSDGTVLEDVWEYNMSASPNLQLHFRDRTDEMHPKLTNSLHARFGASLVPLGRSLLLIGGISSKEILGRADDLLIITVGATIKVEKPNLILGKSAWPLLIGGGAATVSDNEVVVAGGGAVCFSMGSFWNDGYISITTDTADAPGLRPFAISSSGPMKQTGKTVYKQTPNSLPERRGKCSNKGDDKGSNKDSDKGNNKNSVKDSDKDSNKGKPKAKGMGKIRTRKQSVTTIPRIRLRSAEDFSRLLQASKPAIIEQLDLGPCTELWTLDYLKEKLGVDREVVVHDCSSDRMTFKDKNFQYVKKSVAEFLDSIAQGSKTYLRAVSADQPNKLPTKLEDDFPTIAEDFRLPDVLNVVKEAYHSSPLRISGPVSLWLHYDVLANVLCQIKGSKTLRLYPPGDVKYLDFPPGGSSSNTNVLTSQDPKLRHTHPHVASLNPGDILFLPPMWSHTATPEEGYSVAVNVFFRNLDKGYAAGKDVYGNRDLQAYETGRRDVEKIIKAFRDIPDDIRKFYLDRLAMELQEKADLGQTRANKVDLTNNSGT